MQGFAKKTTAVLVTALLAVGGFATSAQALTWNAPSGAIDFGQDFTPDPGKATGSFSGSDYKMSFTAGSTAGLTNFATASSGGTNAARFAAMNALNTPWVELTFTDHESTTDGSWADISLFVNGPGAGNGQRIKAAAGYPEDPAGAGTRWRTKDNPGSNNLTLFGNTTIPLPDGSTKNGFFTEMKYSSGGTRSTPNYLVTAGNPYSDSSYVGFNNALAGIGNNNSANFVQRQDGKQVKIKIGELADGTIEITYTVDGVQYPTWQNDFFVAAGVGYTNFYQLEWRIKGGGFDGSVPTPEVFTFNNIETGGGYVSQLPEPASLTLLAAGGFLLTARRRKNA